jgi:hypothetical protein
MVGCCDGIAVGSQEGSSVTYTADQDLAEFIASVDMATRPSSPEVSLT